MIDKAVFAEGMGQLGGAFGREIDGPVSRTYYGILSAQLDTEQFTKAVLLTIASERFWPSPAVILEKAGRDGESMAQQAFRAVHDALNTHSGYRYLPAEISQSWDAATWAGIKAIGGLREICECTERKWDGMVKRFCEAYRETLNPGMAIEKPVVRKRVAGGGKPTALLHIVKDMALPPGDR